MKRAGPNSTAAKERKRTDTTGIQASLAGRKQCWFADGGEQQRESVQESLWLEFDPICLSFKLENVPRPCIRGSTLPYMWSRWPLLLLLLLVWCPFLIKQQHRSSPSRCWNPPRTTPNKQPPTKHHHTQETGSQLAFPIWKLGSLSLSHTPLSLSLSLSLSHTHTHTPLSLSRSLSLHPCFLLFLFLLFIPGRWRWMDGGWRKWMVKQCVQTRLRKKNKLKTENNTRGVLQRVCVRVRERVLVRVRVFMFWSRVSSALF